MTTFVDNSTVIQAVWLNSVDRAVTLAIGDGSNPPTTPAEAKANLGLDQVNNTSDVNKPISVDVQTALDLKASLSGSETLTNKIINLTDNTLVSTVAQLNTAITDGDVLTTTGTDTLSNKTLDSTCNVSSASGQPFSFRNKLINGGFNINQRAYVSGAAVGANLYGLDRWKMAASADTFTFSTTANKTTVTIPAGKVLQQVIEGLNLQTGTYTLSWEGTAQGKIGAGSLSASGVTGSITGGTNTTIEFGPGTVANAQLEFGTIATPFEQRPIQVELAMCQRYYQWIPINEQFYADAAGRYKHVNIPFSVQMRSVPTMSSNVVDSDTGQTAINVSTLGAANTTRVGTGWSFTALGIGYCTALGYKASASAEL